MVKSVYHDGVDDANVSYLLPDQFPFTGATGWIVLQRIKNNVLFALL